MATTEVLMAGFGGQGMLLSGKLLSYAAMRTGKQVSWLPSYGPEMRGGTANVTVCVSDAPIGSPYIYSPKSLLVMNQPSLEKFGPRVKENGLIIVNSSLIPIKVTREDCDVLYLDAAGIAQQNGTVKASNMVMLGAYVGCSKIVSKELCVELIREEFAKKAKFIPSNIASFEAGYLEGEKFKGDNK